MDIAAHQTTSQLTDADALVLSRCIADPEASAAFRRELVGQLIGYYKTLLDRHDRSPIPAVRRMW